MNARPPRSCSNRSRTGTAWGATRSWARAPSSRSSPGGTPSRSAIAERGGHRGRHGAPGRPRGRAARSITRGVRLVTPAASMDRGLLPDCIWGGWFGYASVRHGPVRRARQARPGARAARRPGPARPALRALRRGDRVRPCGPARARRPAGVSTSGRATTRGRCTTRRLAKLAARAEEIQTHSKPLPAGIGRRRGVARRAHAEQPDARGARGDGRAREGVHRAGDIFQVVLGQRFEKTSAADPFDVYRALRAVNPSPYMVYMQAGACILSPRARRSCAASTHRAAAGARRRGS
jgi:hypothetical protein